MTKIGIIGAGKNGAGHAREFNQLRDQGEVVAVCDIAPAAADAFAQEHGLTPFTAIEPMLEAVDAVVISSPNWLHAEQAIQCAQAGKHLWIEKPLALNVEDAHAVAAAVDEAGVKSFVGFSVRFDPVTVTMLERIRAGDIGQVFSVFSRRTMDILGRAAAKQSWRREFNKSGGILNEILIHEVDWITSLLGFPPSVSCRKWAHDPDDHPRANDHVWLAMHFESATATIEGGQATPVAEFYRGAFSDQGSLYTTEWSNQLNLHLRGEDPAPVAIGDRFNKHAHFLEVIAGTATSVADVHYARRVTQLIDAALESAVTGQTVATKID